MIYNDFDKLFDDLFNKTVINTGTVIRDRSSLAYTPGRCSVDLKDDTLEIAFSVIGHDPKNVEVNLTEDQIHIKAVKDREDNSVVGKLVKDINETITLMKDYDGLSAVAEIKNGVLKISISKKEDKKPKKLSIKF